MTSTKCETLRLSYKSLGFPEWIGWWTILVSHEITMCLKLCCVWYWRPYLSNFAGPAFSCRHHTVIDLCVTLYRNRSRYKGHIGGIAQSAVRMMIDTYTSRVIIARNI